ncbi:MAG TPA: M20 family metallopeptidase [Anaerolineae bacterium]|nr:M20 family metallopeptidase [Anaerolineae bacterium]HQI86212.1 M20 family metallopeptidase [Anaerolineae bacterium]
MQPPRDEAVFQHIEVLRHQLVELRRNFYMHPELSGEEKRTARIVAARLRKLGLAVQTRVGGYGVVGVLQGARPGPTVAYRADMDAMPIQDTLEKSYRSLALGVKHACGHDVHMTVALGAAEVLAARRDDLAGTVKFIFQPAEESLDGARAMLAAGVLEDPKPDAIFALHVSPIPVGMIGLASGACLAGMEEFRVAFSGRTANLDVLTARAASALRALGGGVAPRGMATFNTLIRAMRAGAVSAQEVLVSCWPVNDDPASHAHLLGLVSLPHIDLRDMMRARIRQALDNVVAAVGAGYDLRFTFFNPPLVNDATVARAMLPILKTVVGEDNVWVFHSPYPFAHEDFALYLEHTPGAMFWLGIANPERDIASLLHAPDFDVDEDALVIGVRAVTALLLHGLEISV